MWRFWEWRKKGRPKTDREAVQDVPVHFTLVEAQKVRVVTNSPEWSQGLSDRGFSVSQEDDPSRLLDLVAHFKPEVVVITVRLDHGASKFDLPLRVEQAMETSLLLLAVQNQLYDWTELTHEWAGLTRRQLGESCLVGRAPTDPEV
ncbi:MAG TPA: hypothetical protein VGE59_02345, partial [Patescibacteria group bacterium]